MPDEPHSTEEIQLKGGLPLCIADCLECSKWWSSCIVHKNVDMPKYSHGCCNNRFNIILSRDISRYSQDVASSFPLDFLGCVFYYLPITSSYRYIRPFCRQCSCAGTSKSFTCGQDQCYFLSESQVHIMSSQMFHHFHICSVHYRCFIRRNPKDKE